MYYLGTFKKTVDKMYHLIDLTKEAITRAKLEPKEQKLEELKQKLKRYRACKNILINSTYDIASGKAKEILGDNDINIDSTSGGPPRGNWRQLPHPKKILNTIFTPLFIDFCNRIKIYTISKSICTPATSNSE